MRLSVIRHLTVSKTARDRYEALTPEQRQAVDEILRPEMARGWVPKESDITAAIDAVLRSQST